jgi:hypothetical protein
LASLAHKDPLTLLCFVSNIQSFYFLYLWCPLVSLSFVSSRGTFAYLATFITCGTLFFLLVSRGPCFNGFTGGHG